LDNLPGMAYQCHQNPAWHMLYVSQGCQELTGYSPAELLSTPRLYGELILSEDLPGIQQTIQQAISQHEPYQIRYRLRTAASEIKWVYEQGKTIQSPDGDFLEGFISDITEQHLATNANLRLASVIDQIMEAIVITDLKGKIDYVNPAFEQITGYPRDEALGQHIASLSGDTQDQNFYDKLWKTLQKGETWRGQAINHRKDGQAYREEAIFSPIRGSGGQIINYVAIKRDITQQSELQEQLWQAQKMDAVGRLSGGIAHDFNNILTVIKNYAEFVRDVLPEEDEAFDDINRVIDSTKQAADLTQQLLVFARSKVIRPQIVNLNETIGKMDKMLRSMVRENIGLIINLQPGLSPINVDPGQIEQVIINLVINACDAMPDGGKLLLVTRNVTVSQDDLTSVKELDPGEYVELLVRDTGMGMSEEVRLRIFEPFFTTKVAGKGTGMGLATVYGIVKQHGGNVTVRSKPGLGSVFKVYIPQKQEKAAEPEGKTARLKAPQGHETVLVVEDETEVRRAAVRILQRSGYKVLDAENGLAAVEVIRANDDLQLVVTDVVMPEMDGYALADWIRLERPSLKIIMVSGYAEEQIPGSGVGNHSEAFMQKPFSAFKLAQTVRNLLDSH
jgi:PAS domain S-box-containing protein